METLEARPELVARCGLYCGACRSWRKGRCPGCAANAKATWCRVRTCCHDQGLPTCADCARHADPMDCGTFDNFMSRLFGLLFRSDRGACIAQIRRLGLEGHARAMAAAGTQTLRRGRRRS
jgi:hypothetical protein